MKLHSHGWLMLAVVLVAQGCASNHRDGVLDMMPPSIRRNAIPFTMEEVVSRTWNEFGIQIDLIGTESVEMPGSASQLLVCKYGNKSTGTIYCLDFYRKSKLARGMTGPDLALVHHDSRGTPVKTLAIRTEGQQVIAEIIRAPKEPSTERFSSNRYGVIFDKRFVPEEYGPDLWF